MVLSTDEPIPGPEAAEAPDAPDVEPTPEPLPATDRDIDGSEPAPAGDPGLLLGTAPDCSGSPWLMADPTDPADAGQLTEPAETGQVILEGPITANEAATPVDVDFDQDEPVLTGPLPTEGEVADSATKEVD